MCTGNNFFENNEYANQRKCGGCEEGVPQGTGTACRRMRRTISLCRVALSTDSRLLIQVRPCGPSSTTFNRCSWSKMARADMIYNQGRGESGRALPVQYTMTKSGDTTFAHIQGPATQRPADAWITTVALHFISVLFCCAACLEVSSALEESPILHRGSQARHVNTTTTLLVARARTQTCSRVQSICWHCHVSPSPALLSFAPIVCMHAFC